MNSYVGMLRDLQSAMLEKRPMKIMPGLNKGRPLLEKRLNVYIDGYRARLVQAVLTDYPTFVNYLGMVEAEKLVINYVECTQSYSYTLDVYPLKFAEYVAKCGEDGFATAIAMLESAIAKVFWLPDSEAFIPPASLEPENLMEMCFVQRIASDLIPLEYAVEKYMLSVRSGEEAAVGEENPHHMFIVRHNNEVKRHVIENTEQLILSSLFAGGAVGVVLEEIAEKYPERLPEIEQKLQFWFSKWIENGFFCAA